MTTHLFDFLERRVFLNGTGSAAPARVPNSSTGTQEVAAPLSLPAGVTGPTGLLQTAGTLSVARQSVAAVAVNGQVLFAGGVDSTYSSVVDIYSTVTGSWTTGTLSVPRSSVTAAAVGDFAIFAGGVTGITNDGQQDSSAVDIYNARTGRWSTATLSQARDGMFVAVVGDTAIFAGGTVPGVGPSNVVDLFNASTQTWSTATLSQARGAIAATTVGNLAIFAGGGNFGAAYSNVDIYNASTGQWSTASLSVARAGAAAATVGNLAIFAGGNTAYTPPNAAPASSAVDIYNASTGTWSTASLSEASDGISAATVGNLAVFALGGSAVDIYNAKTGLWSTAALPVPSGLMAVATVGQRAIFAGGVPEVGAASNAVDIFDGATGRITSTTLPAAANDLSAAAAANTALFAGGAATGSPVSSAVALFTAPALTGQVVLPRRSGDATVTLSNTGSVGMGAPASLAVYASTSETLDPSATLLGSVRLRRTLSAGTYVQESVPLSIPPNLPPGSYYLIVAAGPPNQIVEFAVQRRLFNVSQPAATVQRAEVVMPPQVVFSTAPTIGGSILKDADDVLG